MRDRHIELLQAMPIFGGIRADTLHFLLDQTRVVTIPERDYFFHEGEQADSLFVLEQGRVQLLKRWNGRECSLKRLKSGDCFGEVALIDLQPRSASALAIEDCSAITLSAANLYRLYERDLEQFTLIYMNMARELCRRLREADARAFAAEPGERATRECLVATPGEPIG